MTISDEERDELLRDLSAPKKRKNERDAAYKREQRVIDGPFALKERTRNRERRQLPEVKAQRAVENRLYMRRKQEEIAGRPRPQHCEVCGREDTIVFDHCHTSTKFRGWLCFKCNAVLGFVDDDPGILELLAIYLRNHGDSIPDVYTP
jgi:hypothetical protein